MEALFVVYFICLYNFIDLFDLALIEKERVKALIDQAMKGLQESGRIESSSNDQPISIENNQSSLDDIENTLKR